MIDMSSCRTCVHYLADDRLPLEFSLDASLSPQSGMPTALTPCRRDAVLYAAFDLADISRVAVLPSSGFSSDNTIMEDETSGWHYVRAMLRCASVSHCHAPQDRV